MTQTFRSVYPNQTTILDPVAQMRQNIARARASTGDVAPDEFTYLAGGLRRSDTLVSDVSPALRQSNTANAR